MKKAIVFDLDGTLLNSYKHIPIKEKKYIQKLYNNQIKIIIATGRGEEAFGLISDIPYNGVILNNGMQIYYNNKIIKSNFIDKSKVLCALIELDNLNYKIGGVRCNKHYTNFNADKMWNDISNWEKTEIYNLPEQLDKLYIVYQTQLDIVRIVNKIPSEFNVSIARDNLLFIMPNNISKFSSLKFLLEYYNITEQEVVSFGDDLNDLELIKECGIGIAMGNSLDIVKESADCITLTNDEGGIFKMMKEFFPYNN